MKRNILLFLIILIVNGCSVSGHYRSEGPCKGFHKDQQACERAAANSKVIGKVMIGQSLDDVREIMGKDPERRKASAKEEIWSYITDYSNHLFTTIIFKNKKVVEIK